ncbi:MAG: 4-hydroxy-tetrahydrodipicolinate synthase [Lachnospiraceae bacterium]|nr:4-hydroxy-tetrahydrodipicolinate synthase [Lachnospiraceae bacterium]
MAIFTGAGVALVTPFKDNLEVDYDQLEKVIDYQIENGTDCIIICGTTGEASTLTHEEHIEVIRACAAHVNKRIPVIAGTGSNCPETAIYLTQEAEKAGADGALVVTPYYNKATQKGLVKHYKAVAASTDLPVIMYNVPSRTGCNILPATAAQIVKEADNVIGIKEATGDISQVAELMNRTNGEIDLYSGNDDQIVPILSLGGLGVISVLSNVAPQETHDIVAKYMAGDTKGSLELQMKYLDLIHALFCEVNPIPVNKAVELMGLCSGRMRGPMTELEPEHVTLLENTMKAVGIL